MHSEITSNVLNWNSVGQVSRALKCRWIVTVWPKGHCNQVHPLFLKIKNSKMRLLNTIYKWDQLKTHLINIGLWSLFVWYEVTIQICTNMVFNHRIRQNSASHGIGNSNRFHHFTKWPDFKWHEKSLSLVYNDCCAKVGNFFTLSGQIRTDIGIHRRAIIEHYQKQDIPLLWTTWFQMT